MAKTPVSKFMPKVPKVPGVDAMPGAGRRAAYSASTKRALVDVAEELFTANGYAATSLDAVVAGAQVTKGALYHHFSGKQALFEAVFERVEEDAARRIQQALRAHRDPWEKAREGLRAFLTVVREPGYRTIVIQEGPSVLGYERFRAQEERSTYASVVEIVRSTLAAGSWDLPEEMLQTYAQIFFGALSSAGASVATASDPALAAQRVEAAIGFLLSGVEGLVAAGVELPNGVGRATVGDPAEEARG
ncbi:TetR/AcrR family transcriptional regulator [Nocardioides sp. GY 10113]|uniref:TetR/AcrR family transcriptional regulator n=1 Tax=Nocardioides sp. GY 10113 TaxID=2569761 RepID=UPI0010A887A9|nr:TetR/AcrR family transcriptional regulator [Nocardioides sp. GY 10113]TIC87505.1 TetR/AcrR family transcriptional regulator [Nocardioides sp. GY 10113]